MSLFGTDGVRGVANQRITPDLALNIGLASGRWMQQMNLPMRAVMGRDTRRSGTMIGAALASGLCSAGVEVTALGVAPTGAIAHIAMTQGYGLGAVLSASHNPSPDNGIKLISHQGRKVPAEAEDWIEAHLGEAFERPTGGEVGRIESTREPLESYLQTLAGWRPQGFQGLKVAVDGANGAASELGPELLRRLGAQVSTTACEPDGMNINDECGATVPARIQAFTKESGADVGVAFDGDADRAIFCDANGFLVNGDRTMGIWAVQRHAEDRLQPQTVVGTVMSNMGFERYLSAEGIALERTNVGDKYVSARLIEIGGKVGGEQSGHIIFPERGPTGDGLITMLEFLAAVQDSGRPLTELANAFDNWPQLLVNLEIETRDGWDQKPEVPDTLKRAEDRLGGQGRVLVRPSGTQPMLRVMVEAKDERLRDEIMDLLLDALTPALGGKLYSRVDLTHALGD